MALLLVLKNLLKKLLSGFDQQPDAWIIFHALILFPTTAHAVRARKGIVPVKRLLSA
jgi:hypothetical protein